MSEVRGSSKWLCPGCSEELGEVMNFELLIGDVETYTSGINVVCVCPNCSYKKIWYPRMSLEDVIRIVMIELDKVTARRRL